MFKRHAGNSSGLKAKVLFLSSSTRSKTLVSKFPLLPLRSRLWRPSSLHGGEAPCRFAPLSRDFRAQHCHPSCCIGTHAWLSGGERREMRALQRMGRGWQRGCKGFVSRESSGGSERMWELGGWGVPLQLEQGPVALPVPRHILV